MPLRPPWRNNSPIGGAAGRIRDYSPYLAEPGGTPGQGDHDQNRPGRDYRRFFADLDARGHLVLKQNDGRQRTIYAGDVFFLTGD
ncbi:hypothetical protein QW131_10545 [Roseibium salinum]|nr:hypothetical protein [Roseibium salinum]